MAGGRALARGVMTVTGARALGLVLSLVQVKLAVTYLGPTGYGMLVTATLFVNSFGAWTELGMGSVVVRRVSGRGMDLGHQVGLSMAISLLIVVPLLAVANGAAYVMYDDRPEVRVGIALLSVGLAATSWATCFNPVAQVNSRFGHYAAADLIGRVLSLAVIATAIVADLGLFWFFIAQLMVPVGQLVAMVRLGRLLGSFRPVWRWQEMRDLLVETLPMTYIAAVGVLYFSIDGVMLSQLSTTEQVGAYGLAYRIVGNFTIVSASLAAVLSARFASDASQATSAFAATISHSVKAVLLVAAPLAVLVWGIAPELITLIGSAEMVHIGADPLGIVSIGVGVGMVSAVVSAALIADYQQRILTVLNTVNLLLNIAANAVLIPLHGAEGAAMALVLSEVTGLVVCLVLMVRRYGPCLPAAAMIRMVPALGLGLAVEVFVPGQSVLRIVTVGAAYAIGLAVFGVVRPREILSLLGRTPPPASGEQTSA